MTATRMPRLLLSIALLCGLATAARADGTDDPAVARKSCEQLKQADTPEKLKQCCDDQIIVGDNAEQARLVAQCVQGKGKKTAPAKTPAKTPKKK